MKHHYRLKQSMKEESIDRENQFSSPDYNSNMSMTLDLNDERKPQSMIVEQES